MVIRCSSVIPDIKAAFFRCLVCGHSLSSSLSTEVSGPHPSPPLSPTQSLGSGMTQGSAAVCFRDCAWGTKDFASALRNSRSGEFEAWLLCL